MRVLHYLLLPFSVVYGAAVFLRNRLFDWGILQSSRGAITTIVIGNLSTGGTGKTPHLEFLTGMLQNRYRIAILSRGYGRRTKGFVLADEKSTAETIGDEPMQMHKKFPLVPLAVAENRLQGIHRIKKLFPDTEIVLLDDGLQHRKLRGDLNLLLTNYNKPYFSDVMLPAGTLRDNKREKRRAQIIIVTKCPLQLSPADREQFEKRIAPEKEQQVFFSRMKYGSPVQFSGPPSMLEDHDAVIGFAGIAHPDSFRQYLIGRFSLKNFKTYPDHHPFTTRDYQDLHQAGITFGGLLRGIVTTEKDASRMALNKLPVEMKSIPLFYIPAAIELIEHSEEFERTFTPENLKKQ